MTEKLALGPGIAAAWPEIEAVIVAADGLLLYGRVLASEPGEAYLALLRSLVGDDAYVIRRCAAAFFGTVAVAVDPALPGPGDAWQRHLARRILLDENPFSRLAQRDGPDGVPPGLLRAARHDLVALGRFFHLAGARLAALVVERLGEADWLDLDDLGPEESNDPLIARLAETEPDEWGECLSDFAQRYRARGVGRFAEHRAFRWVHRGERGELVPIRRPDPISFGDLIGYAEQRAIVQRNTEHFLEGRPANNLLLYGERGTGKSSTVKALLNAYADRGLRLVDVGKSALGDFPEIVEELANRPERFVVFVDDLSFDENETGYTELKALLEGGVEVRPDNVVLYATSNRRHLIIERFSDRAAPSDEIHAQDTLQEKLSLADRFGVTVIFMSPDQEQYLEIVRGLARRRGLAIDDAQLRRRALQWASWNNGRSGRTARQFVDDLAAELGRAAAENSGSL